MLIYILKVSICWLAFYGLYHFFLRKETFFKVNRAYLIGSLILGVLIPFLEYFFHVPGNEIVAYYAAPINDQFAIVNESMMSVPDIG